MGSNHDHGSAAVREGHQKKLVMALALTGSFMIAEVIGAWITGSLALLSDASHMFTDTAALAISLIALQIAKRPADQKSTATDTRIQRKLLSSLFAAPAQANIHGHLRPPTIKIAYPCGLQTNASFSSAVSAPPPVTHQPADPP